MCDPSPTPSYVLSQPLLLQFISSVKEKAAMIMFCAGKYSQAEVLFHESNADPRKVGVFNQSCDYMDHTHRSKHCLRACCRQDHHMNGTLI